MAGMAEMAQMAALLKYKRDPQCRCNANCGATKDRRFAQTPEENYCRNIQDGWRNLKEHFGYKTYKSLDKKVI